MLTKEFFNWDQLNKIKKQMREKYSELKYPSKKYCLGHTINPATFASHFENKRIANVELQIQNESCNCGFCLDNLFSYLKSK